MSEGEFSLIEKYFSSQALRRKTENIELGIGDDAAVLNVPAGQKLVATMDTLVSGVHFPLETNAFDIAYKSLAVNVSDLAAMAATPAYFLLSLTLADMDETFLNAFSEGLFAAADEFDIALVGGDTCKGPLSISIQASGFIPGNNYITRFGARPGDKILVSGELGAAALGLEYVQHRVDLSGERQHHCLQSLNRPRPRLEYINLLRNYATSAIDVSDGLLGDLKHILKKSRAGAVINKQQLPVYPGLNELQLVDLALTGGDDYQLLFTVAEKHLDDCIQQASQQNLDISVIGDIVTDGFIMLDHDQSINLSNTRGFDHFVA